MGASPVPVEAGVFIDRVSGCGDAGVEVVDVRGGRVVPRRGRVCYGGCRGESVLYGSLELGEVEKGCRGVFD
jgi:hypothetical protein